MRLPLRQALALPVAAALALALSACAPSSSVTRVLDAYKQLELAKANYPVTQQAIDAQPYAVMGVQVKNGVKGLLVLRQQQGDVNTWRSDNGVLVATRKGRVIHTIGFPQDLKDAATLQGLDPLGGPLQPSQTYIFSRRIDLSPSYYGLNCTHTLSYIAQETVQIHGHSYKLNHWKEQARVKELSRTWNQEHWVDPSSGEVWKSVQQVGEDTQLTYELLKAPPVL